jgi:hypothetical protein
VPGLSRVKHIASGQFHTFAITDDNRLYGWGCNKFGQLGIDPTLHQTVLTPLEISLPPDSIDSQTLVHSGWSHGALLTGNIIKFDPKLMLNDYFHYRFESGEPNVYIRFTNDSTS